MSRAAGGDFLFLFFFVSDAADFDMGPGGQNTDGAGAQERKSSTNNNYYSIGALLVQRRGKRKGVCRRRRAHSFLSLLLLFFSFSFLSPPLASFIFFPLCAFEKSPPLAAQLLVYDGVKEGYENGACEFALLILHICKPFFTEKGNASDFCTLEIDDHP